MRKSVLFATAWFAALSGAAQAYVTVDVRNSAAEQALLNTGASTEHFNGVSADGAFTSTFGGSGVTGTFSGFTLSSPLAKSGFGSSNHLVVTEQASIILSKGVKYLGLRADALDGNNTIELLRGGHSLGWFNLVDTPEKAGMVSSKLASGIEKMMGWENGGPYTYVNFFTDESFDEIRFSQSAASFSLDDVAIANAVPEPATWAMMILGFGTAGAVLRRRQKQAVRFA
jgi:hypothetical protein